MTIYELIVSPGRAEHIARHHVSVAEAEEVAFGQSIIYRLRQRRYGLLGRTNAGRYLVVIVAPRREPGVYGLVTARDADQAERRRYHRTRRR